jgi:hypothetical protein
MIDIIFWGLGFVHNRFYKSFHFMEHFNLGNEDIEIGLTVNSKSKLRTRA